MSKESLKLALMAIAATLLPAHALAEGSQEEAAAVFCDRNPSPDCIDRYYKNTPEASILRGGIVYMHYCSLCHGPEGRGDGRAARLHTPPPFDLTTGSNPAPATIPRDRPTAIAARPVSLSTHTCPPSSIITAPSINGRTSSRA